MSTSATHSPLHRGALVPPLDRVLRIAEPARLWRVELADGTFGWWRRSVTPLWRVPLTWRAGAQSEAAALLLLRARGVPAAEPVAWSERRCGPWLRETALLTREAADLVRLDDFLRDESEPARRAAALEAAGAWTARMHARGIGHFRLLPHGLHVERARPERAWILHARHVRAWSGPVPRRVRLLDLCTLAGPSSRMAPLDAEALIESYERHGGTVTAGRRLICASPCALRVQRLAYALSPARARHSPERFVGAVSALRADQRPAW